MKTIIAWRGLLSAATIATMTTLLLAGFGSGGCATAPSSSTPKLARVTGESVVLSGQEPARLALAPLRAGSVRVRSTYLEGLPETVHYEAGRDYVLEAEAGLIRRTPGSRLPDFATNVLYGAVDFDHSKFPGFGNNGFFVFVDYAPARPIAWPQQAPQGALLTNTQHKLRAGQKVTLVAYGDSITTGCDVTRRELFFGERWAEALRRKYPRAEIVLRNGATGGDGTGHGLARLEEKVLRIRPDLVFIGFGMNDHNIGAYGTPLDKFEENLRTLIDRIRQACGADIVLYSAFPPNPQWRFGSKNMEAYALATEKVAREKQCAFGDVYRNWLVFSERKKPEDMLGNNINHPNDFSHGIYFEVLQALGL